MWSSTLLQFRKQNKENKRGTYRQIADYFQYLPLWVTVHTYSNANVFHLRQAVTTSVYAAPPAPASPTLSLSSSPCLPLLESRPCSASSLPPSSSHQPASSSLTPSVRPSSRPDASAARGCVAAERDEFAGALGVPAFGEDSPLPPCLLQRLALRHPQAHRHQASLQERVGAPAASGTEEWGSGIVLLAGLFISSAVHALVKVRWRWGSCVQGCTCVSFSFTDLSLKVWARC